MILIISLVIVSYTNFCLLLQFAFKKQYNILLAVVFPVELYPPIIFIFTRHISILFNILNFLIFNIMSLGEN